MAFGSGYGIQSHGPDNYNLDVPQSAGQSFGNSFVAAQAGAQKQRADAVALAAQQQMTSDLTDLSRNPTVSTINNVMAKYPQISEKFKPLLESVNAQQKQAHIGQASDVYASLISGRKDIAKRLLTDQATAARNSGNEQGAKSAETMAELLDNGDQGLNTVLSSAGMFLSQAMGADKFAGTFKDMEDVRLKNEAAPGELAKTKAITLKDQMEAVKPVGDLAQQAKTLGVLKDDGTIDQSTKAGKDLAFKATHYAASGSGSGGGGLPPGPSGTASGPSDLTSVPENWRSTVKALGEYRANLSDYPTRPAPGSPSKAQMLQMVMKAYPNYSIGDAKTNHKFMLGLSSDRPSDPGGIILASEKMLGHAASLSDLTEKLGNSSGFLGHVVDVAKGPYTEAMKPAAGEWLFQRGKLIEEANKLATGGVPDAKSLADDVKNMKMTDTIDKQRALIHRVAEMSLESVQGIRQQRDNILGANAPDDSMLSQKAMDAITKIYGTVGATPPDLGSATAGKGYSKTAQANNPGKASVSGASHPDSSQMQEGTISNSGKYVWKGGAWVAR